MDVDVYRQVNRRGNIDSVEVVVTGPDQDYVVVLGCFPGHYVLRFAYPAGSSYVRGKVMRDGELVERIRP